MKKRKKFNYKRLLLLIAVIIIIVAIINILNTNKKPEKITLLLDNELIELKNEMINEKNIIYISKDDIEAIFDPNIYYNEAEKELITTYNKHIALLKVDEKFMVVNDSNAELVAPMIEKNNKIYLPFSEMGIVYDLEFNYSEEAKRLIADSVSKEKKQALTLKNCNIKKKPSLFSGKIEKVLNGEEVTIVEDASKKYFKVRTSKGNIGYMKKKKLSEPEIVRENWNEEKLSVEVIKEASDLDKNYKQAKLSKDKQNVVVPTFFYLEENGEILDKTESENVAYKEFTHWATVNQVEVWATLENNEDVSNLLLTYADRNKIINALYEKLVQYQFSGVNIDFKKINDVNSFNRFIIELTPRLKELGIKVAVTNNEIVDEDKLSKVVHIVIE